MTALQPAVVAVPPTISTPKMEDRKRSLAGDVDDLAPSRKRIVKDDIGQQMRLDADKEKEIENYQKDAIYRQMKEYRREKKHFEDLYLDLNKKITHHDDHLRAVDAWFAQLLDELRVLAADSLPTPQATPITSTGGELFQTSLTFAEQDSFASQLRAQGSSVKAAIADIFSRIPAATPEIQTLQAQIASALAQEKAARAECERLNVEKAAMSEQLDSSVWRYMKAEKALDRAKSAQVQKLERQAYASGNAASPTEKKSATPVKTEHAEKNGDLTNGVDASEAETARLEAEAVAETRKKQLAEIETENDRLTNALSAARTKLVSLTSDDYAESALFKTVKGQYEDVITRVNELEATNVKLREEARKLQSERTSYRLQVDEESRAQVSAVEAQIAHCEVDLVRIRQERDNHLADITVRKAAEENRRFAADQSKQLAEARDQKIVSLESHLDRLKLQLAEAVKEEVKSESKAEIKAESSPSDLSAFDKLNDDYRKLQQGYTLLGQEQASIEGAWRKAQALASKKVTDLAEHEEKLSRLSAEKAKADQKYFATMKVRDSLVAELKVLKTKDARSSEIVTQLKEADARSRELLTAQDRQLTEARELLATTERQYRAAEQKQIEAQTQLVGARKQADEFKTMVSSKDEESLALKKAKRDVETALESSNARLEETKKQFEAMRKSRATQSSADSDDWRRVAICPICNTNIRNKALKLCGHVFCSDCVQDLISNRSRKCPSCGKAFGMNDFMTVVLT